MNATSIGDLSLNFLLGRERVELASRAQRLGSELASGRASDLTEQVSGRFGALADIERQLQVQDSFANAAADATTEAAAMQTALTRVQDAAQQLAGRALTAGAAGGGTAGVATVAREAGGALEAMVGALNTHIGGRSLFAGTEVSGPALAPAADIRDALALALAGATTPDDIRTLAQDFFEAPGGVFRTTLYLGGDTGPSPRRLGAGEAVALDIRADDAALRAQIGATALLSLVDDPALGLDAEGQRVLLAAVGADLQAAQPGLAELRGRLGSAEATIDRATARLAAESTALQKARNDIVSTDAFEIASELERVQFQLETILTLTVRSSRLNLTSLLS